jgi:hypothetical protein
MVVRIVKPEGEIFIFDSKEKEIPNKNETILLDGEVFLVESRTLVLESDPTSKRIVTSGVTIFLTYKELA